VTKIISTTKGKAYLISVENDFSGSNNLSLTLNGTPVYTSLSVADNAAANVCIIGDGTEVTLVASDSAGGFYNLRVFRIRRNRINLWDGSGVTLRFDNTRNAWVESSDINEEHGSTLGQKVVLFKDGNAYIQDDLANKGNLFGVQHESGVVVVTNQYPGDVKEPMVVSIDSTSPPSYMHFRTEKPYIQSSDLVADEFTTLEGMHYAEVKNDRLTPGMTPDDGLLRGDAVRGNDVIATVVYEGNNSNVTIQSVDINYKLSKGHK
jgi:hypothetical protein